MISRARAARCAPCPVSYTHLDVYKRQVETFAPGVFDAAQAAPTRGGSWVTTGRMTAPGVNPGAVLASQLLVTPGDVVRRHAQYNETSYNAFLVANAARTGTPLPMLPADAGMLRLKLTPGAGREGTPALSFGGVARFSAAPGSTGAGGTPVSYTHLDVYKRQGLEHCCEKLEKKYVQRYGPQARETS